MKSVFTIALVLSLGACSWFQKKPDVQPPSGGGCDRGVFHPGPYTDMESGKSCNAPGGYCDSDKSCHSSAQKCGCAK